MRKSWTVMAAIIAITLFAIQTAGACPGGYVPCGEKQQLCCPGR